MAHGPSHHGDMDIHEQRSTYDLFMGLTKWGSLAVAALVLFLVVSFCAGDAGGMGVGAVAALGLVVVGFFLLKSKPKAKAKTAGAH
jgi:hypothetical protein